MKIILTIWFCLASSLLSQNFVNSWETKAIPTDSTGSLIIKLIAIDQLDGLAYGFAKIETLNTIFPADSNGIVIINDLIPDDYELNCYALGYSNVKTKITAQKNEVITKNIYVPTDAENLEKQAEIDIQNDKIQILVGGLLAKPIPDEIQDILELKYGFRYVYGGCDIYSSDLYNAKMEEYLEKRNGQRWYENYRKDLDSLKSKLDK